MDFRLLGPLEVVGDAGAVRVGSPRQRALLALLLLDAGRVVPVPRIVDDLWGEDVPGSAAKMVQIAVSQLRKELPEGTLCTRQPGYVLDLSRHSLDLHRFRELAERGRAALADGRPAEADELLGAALALWRGPALAEFSEPFATVERERLAEQQLACLEDRIEARLALGRDRELVGELEALVRQHPLRERPRAQLMLALYRAGRQADALAAYRDAQRTLDEELGLHPSPGLQRLEQAILRHDDTLGLRPSAPPSSPGLVGRARELARLAAVLPSGPEPAGGAVLVSGPPGVGKTRLVEELSALAECSGARVARGHCQAGQGAPPYWPWREVLRDLGGPPVFAEAEAPAADPREARFRLFDAITAFVLEAAERDPLLVVLDDLHAADADSLSLLAFLGRRLRDGGLVVVATMRDEAPHIAHPLTDALAALRRSELAALDLDGLAPDAVAELVERNAGRTPPPELVAELHAATDGNALFVSEVIRLAVGRTAEDESADAMLARFRTALPAGVRAAIATRLTAASPACREVVLAAALLGTELTAARLRAVAALEDDDAVLDAIEEAVGAALLAEHPTAVGRYELAHALVGDAALGQLSATRRARLHLAAADALERHHGGEGVRAGEVAHHLVAAGGLAEPARIVRVCRAGAEQALRSEAYHEAARLLEQALEAKDVTAMDDEAAELLTDLARAQLATLGLHDNATFREAVGRMRRAFDHYVHTGARSRALEVAALRIPLIYRTTALDEYRDLTTAALELAEPGTLEQGRLLTSRGWFAGANEANHPAAAESFAAAVAIARRHGDRALETRSFIGAAMVDFQHTRWASCIEAANAALELALEGRDARAEVLARIWAARAAMVLGEAVAAREHVTASIGVAERVGEPFSLNGAFLNATWLAKLEGRWDDARAAAERSLAVEPHDTRVLACLALVEHERGNRERGRDLARRMTETWAATAREPQAVAHNIVTTFVPLLRRVDADGPLEAAVARRAAATAWAATALHPLSRLMVHTGLGLLAVEDGDAEAAATHYDVLCEQAGRTLLVAAASADRVLGLLADTMGDAAGAERHLRAAVAHCEAAGWHGERGRAASDLAAFTARSRP